MMSLRLEGTCKHQMRWFRPQHHGLSTTMRAVQLKDNWASPGALATPRGDLKAPGGILGGAQRPYRTPGGLLTLICIYVYVYIHLHIYIAVHMVVRQARVEL